MLAKVEWRRFLVFESLLVLFADLTDGFDESNTEQEFLDGTWLLQTGKSAVIANVVIANGEKPTRFLAGRDVCFDRNEVRKFPAPAFAAIFCRQACLYENCTLGSLHASFLLLKFQALIS